MDFIFSSPKRLLLAEKRAITQELRQLKAENAGGSAAGGLRPKQLLFNKDVYTQQTSPTAWPTTTTTTSVNGSKDGPSPLERRKLELIENVSFSFIEIQLSSAAEHLSKLQIENNSLQTVTRGRICSNCHQTGHNKNNCKGLECDSHTKCGLKDKHQELNKAISETKKMVGSLTKNLETAKQTLLCSRCKVHTGVSSQ